MEAAFALALAASRLRADTGGARRPQCPWRPSALVSPPLTEIKDKWHVGQAPEGGTAALERAKRLAADAQTGDLVGAGKKLGAVTGETGASRAPKPAERLRVTRWWRRCRPTAGQLSAPVKASRAITW